MYLFLLLCTDPFPFLELWGQINKIINYQNQKIRGLFYFNIFNLTYPCNKELLPSSIRAFLLLIA